jgi:excisionase family DNA binding protein
MSVELRIVLDDDQLELVAARAADLVARRSTSDAAEPWLNAKQAAQHLACPPSRIYALVSAGRLTHHKDASRLLFRRSELDRFVLDGGARRP